MVDVRSASGWRPPCWNRSGGIYEAGGTTMYKKASPGCLGLLRKNS